jgi:hypothetical protein
MAVSDVVVAEGSIACFMETKHGGVPHVMVGHQGVGQDHQWPVRRSFVDNIVGDVVGLQHHDVFESLL